MRKYFNYPDHHSVTKLQKIQMHSHVFSESLSYARVKWVQDLYVYSSSKQSFPWPLFPYHIKIDNVIMASHLHCRPIFAMIIWSVRMGGLVTNRGRLQTMRENRLIIRTSSAPSCLTAHNWLIRPTGLVAELAKLIIPKTDYIWVIWVVPAINCCMWNFFFWTKTEQNKKHKNISYQPLPGILHLLLLYHYCQTSDIKQTIVGNKIVDNSDVVGAPPVGAAPTTSSFLM